MRWGDVVVGLRVRQRQIKYQILGPREACGGRRQPRLAPPPCRPCPTALTRAGTTIRSPPEISTHACSKLLNSAYFLFFFRWDASRASVVRDGEIQEEGFTPEELQVGLLERSLCNVPPWWLFSTWAAGGSVAVGSSASGRKVTGCRAEEESDKTCPVRVWRES